MIEAMNTYTPTISIDPAKALYMAHLLIAIHLLAAKMLKIVCAANGLARQTNWNDAIRLTQPAVLELRFFVSLPALSASAYVRLWYEV
jgi:hypothetical protein